MQISLNLCPNRDIYAFWDPFCWYLLDLALPFRIWKSRNNPDAGEVITILETHNAPIQVVRGLHTGEVITGLSDNTINLEGRHMRANLFCSYRNSADTVRGLVIMTALGILCVT